MTSSEIDTAMVLAAGLGTRMKPLTNDTPKPLLRVAGSTLLDRTLSRAREIGVGRAVVNAHYLSDQVRAHLCDDRDVLLSDETDHLLETGGGVKKALALIDRPAFLVVNSDNVWTGASALQPLLAAWRPETMDALLLMVPIENARGYTRAGDFSLDPDGRLVRRGDAPRAPFVYTGAQILSAEAFDGTPEGAFSLNLVWDALIARGRAFGCAHAGGWVDVGTPEGITTAEAALAEAGEL